MNAGFARTDITPPVGSEFPGGFTKFHSAGVHDPLYAEACVLLDGSARIAIVGIDALVAPHGVVATARARIQERAGIPGTHVMIAASHTHTGGPLIECFSSEADSDYCELVAERITQAVCQAADRAEPALMLSGSGRESGVSFNRRFRMRDGATITHPGKLNPDIVEAEGPIDPEVAVVSFTGADGRLLGCIVNFACHCTTMSGDQVSADWVRYLRSTIRGALASPDMGVVFLNGACGNITQVDNLSGGPAEFGETWSKRVGMAVGAEAVKVVALNTPGAKDGVLAAVVEAVDLPIRSLSADDDEVAASERPALGLGNGPEDIWRAEIPLVRAMREQSTHIRTEIQALRVGPVGIVANPCEMFVELGLAIKKQSPTQLTMVAELTNGYSGYLPTAEAFSGGGYETRTARSSFLAPEAGIIVVDTAVRALLRSG